MPHQAEWTASAAQVATLRDTAGRLRDALDRDTDADSIEAFIREVRASAKRLANGMTLAKKTRGTRIPVPHERFSTLPNQVDQILSNLRAARRKKPQESDKVQNGMAKVAGYAVYAAIKDALDSLDLDKYKLR